MEIQPSCPSSLKPSATLVMDPGIVWFEAHGNVQIVRPPRPYTCPLPAVPGGPGCAQVAAALYTQPAGSPRWASPAHGTAATAPPRPSTHI
jgi:hypothetical protein